MKLLILILLILSAPSIAMAEDELPTGTDLAALCQWQSLHYAYLVKIEAYAAANCYPSQRQAAQPSYA